MMRIFPHWARILGVPQARLVGRDLPLDADPDEYRRAVEQVRQDPLTLGALVTTHKVRLLAAARDLLDELDPNAALLEEVSAIAKRGGRLIGAATDPVSAGKTLAALLGPGYFARTRGEALILGAGGAGAAIAAHLLSDPGSGGWPARITMVDRSSERLEALARIAQRISPQAYGRLELRFAYPGAGDEQLAQLPTGSLVVNATGMGKDLPGSPISDDALFPERAVVWELNYRGELAFLRQARAQEQSRSLTVEDGWRYFLYGWCEVLAQVLDRSITPEQFAELRDAAERLRG
jgi:shikimate 5-dehydrogenase